MDHDWRTLLTDYRGQAQPVLSKLTEEYLDGVYGAGTMNAATDLGVSFVPSYGMNSTFVGGNAVHGGTLLTNRNPWDNPGNKLAATRVSEVINAARLVTFAPSASARSGAEPQIGSPFATPRAIDVLWGSVEIRPPMLAWNTSTQPYTPIDPQWTVDTSQDTYLCVGSFAAGDGVPVARWGGSRVPCAKFDGSVSDHDIEELAEDFRLWSPYATLGQ